PAPPDTRTDPGPRGSLDAPPPARMVLEGGCQSEGGYQANIATQHEGKRWVSMSFPLPASNRRVAMVRQKLRDSLRQRATRGARWVLFHFRGCSIMQDYRGRYGSPGPENIYERESSREGQPFDH